MVAVQLASIIVGAISLIGIIGAAGVTAYFAYWSDRRKRHIDAVATLNEYYDPLLIAAVTLRHKIRRLAGDYGHDEYTGGRRGGTYYEPMNPDSRHDGATSSSGGNSYLVTHTAFLVGQFLSWVHILRQECQFLNIQRRDETRLLRDAFFDIERVWSYQDGKPYVLWRGQQAAIGELMTRKTASGRCSCVGYAAFYERWRNDDGEFKNWFGDFAIGGQKWDRMKEVNKSLDKLIRVLDPQGVFSTNYDELEKGMKYSC